MDRVAWINLFVCPMSRWDVCGGRAGMGWGGWFRLQELYLLWARMLWRIRAKSCARIVWLIWDRQCLPSLLLDHGTITHTQTHTHTGRIRNRMHTCKHTSMHAPTQMISHTHTHTHTRLKGWYRYLNLHTHIHWFIYLLSYSAVCLVVLPRIFEIEKAHILTG